MPERRLAGAKRLLLLIDPPYEGPDEVWKVLALMADVRRTNPGAVIALWAPIEDLDGLNSLMVGVEDAARGAPVLLAETRLRPLDDPVRLNGSAMFVLNPSASLASPAQEIVSWMTKASGEAGAFGRAAFL